MTNPAQQRAQIATCLKQFDFSRLFIEELGWNRYRDSLRVEAANATYALRGVAEKQGVAVLVCDPDANGGIPDYDTRKKIDEQVTKQVHEHLIIFVDGQRNRQSWLWVRRKQGQRTAYRGEEYYKGQSGERLIQKLQQIAIDMGDEESISLINVMLRLEKGFDVERTTKKFYERFQTEHKRFEQVITGIADDEWRRWYASLMLNRLMFIYFIQRKRFLDDNHNYLADRLARIQALGPDRFHSFYRGFLLHLFHDGLGKPPVDRVLAPELAALIGSVPYLNGGLFEVHKIEHDNRAIAIPDSAFERIFAFFDEYDWHLDNRPQANGNEINPDVLGYIFEKYINQKQMGAYYTKEDITGYIGRNTIVPFLFDRAKAEDPDAFEADGEVWRLLHDDPDRYIYEAVRRGVDEPLPSDIAAGIQDVAKRTGWNKPASAPFALPTETWREHVARRTRCLDLRERLASGGVTEVNDLITLNLDIELFARDVIERCEDPRLLRALWKAITAVTVLDPTCGSGAFLFAALNILEPLYDACLTRMAAFVADYQRAGHLHSGQDFAATLARVSAHTNHRYFVLKSIIINNLYGVDIMEEACEIAKLRLFLKLVAQVEAVDDLEPLPDIDFNIRAGNTLVGFTTLDAVRQAMTYDVAGLTRKLMLDVEDDAALTRIEQRAAEIGRAYQHFQHLQSELGIGAELHAAKDDLRRRLDALREELDRYLAREYGISARDDLFKLKAWRDSHQPLHWFVEFYDIVHDHGGFDVIIGNPPYVEYGPGFVRDSYKVQGYSTLPCGNLHAFVAERALLTASTHGRIGLIVPLPAINTVRMQSLQHLIKPTSGTLGRTLHVSAFDERPSSLFSGVDQRLVIELFGAESPSPIVASTGITRWAAATRDTLFATMTYACQTPLVERLTNSVLKIKRSDIETSMLAAIYSNRPIDIYKTDSVTSELLAYRTAGGRYWKVVLDHPFEGDTLSGKITYLRNLSGKQAVALISSSTFWWYYSTHFDMYNLKDYMIFGFRFSNAAERTLTALSELGHDLVESLVANSINQTVNSKTRGQVTSRLFSVGKSKSVIDEIDRVLAKHYGFTDEELDFIINYDIKYRMGQETADSDDGEE